MLRVGDGAAALSASSTAGVYLDEYDLVHSASPLAPSVRMSSQLPFAAASPPASGSSAPVNAALTVLGREAGLPPKVAEARAEEAIVRIEGALVLCAGTGDVAPFERALAAIRVMLAR